MKRMVKNGDLIDVEPDGTITVAGKPIGGGGSGDRELTLTMPYSFSEPKSKLYIDEDTWTKIRDLYYDTIKIFYKDGNPLGIFHAFHYIFVSFGEYQIKASGYILPTFTENPSSDVWYGSSVKKYDYAKITCQTNSAGKYIEISPSTSYDQITLSKSKFDALYKLADKPTQDGTYVLKATVSGGAVTYTWVAQ